MQILLPNNIIKELNTTSRYDTWTSDSFGVGSWSLHHGKFNIEIDFFIWDNSKFIIAISGQHPEYPIMLDDKHRSWQPPFTIGWMARLLQLYAGQWNKPNIRGENSRLNGRDSISVCKTIL